ncbi:hypothetical protein SADUNF_Sadunf02G0189100 [Salix dunnii]|uniref:Protein transport protein SEC23 n=1 Tax=Salix dunnii TaxID=1413687 RepID=A0A835N8R3_9ROSI|nr:hypothetical protein SADUNF_Sadunf02G0189100 [Salix dunnii]
MPVLPYSPLRCRTCRSILRRFLCKALDLPLLLSTEPVPSSHTAISDNNLPAELFTHYTIIEHEEPQMISPSSTSPMIFMFVMDTIMIEEEMA